MSIRMYACFVACIYSLCFEFATCPTNLAGSALFIFLLIGVREFLRREEVPLCWYTGVVSALCIMFSLSLMITTDTLILTLSLIAYGVSLSFLLVMLIVGLPAAAVSASLPECYFVSLTALTERGTYVIKKLLRLCGITAGCPLPIRFLLVCTLPVVFVRIFWVTPSAKVCASILMTTLILYTMLTTRASASDALLQRTHKTPSWKILYSLVLTIGCLLLFSASAEIDYAIRHTPFQIVFPPLLLIGGLSVYYVDYKKRLNAHPYSLFLPGFLFLIYILFIYIRSYGVTHLSLLYLVALLGCTSSLLSLWFLPKQPQIPRLLVLFPLCTLGVFGISSLDEHLLTRFPPRKHIANELLPDYDYLLTHNYDMSHVWADVFISIHDREHLDGSISIDCNNRASSLQQHHQQLLNKVRQKAKPFSKAIRYNSTEHFVADWLQANKRLLHETYQRFDDHCLTTDMEVL